ncbi:hypothetical protein OROMI_004076 [Orobanche minor]
MAFHGDNTPYVEYEGSTYRGTHDLDVIEHIMASDLVNLDYRVEKFSKEISMCNIRIKSLMNNTSSSSSENISLVTELYDDLVSLLSHISHDDVAGQNLFFYGENQRVLILISLDMHNMSNEEVRILPNSTKELHEYLQNCLDYVSGVTNWKLSISIEEIHKNSDMVEQGKSKEYQSLAPIR